MSARISLRPPGGQAVRHQGGSWLEAENGSTCEKRMPEPKLAPRHAFSASWRRFRALFGLGRRFSQVSNFSRDFFRGGNGRLKKARKIARAPSASAIGSARSADAADAAPAGRRKIRAASAARPFLRGKIVPAFRAPSCWWSQVVASGVHSPSAAAESSGHSMQGSPTRPKSSVHSMHGRSYEGKSALQPMHGRFAPENPGCKKRNVRSAPKEDRSQRCYG